MRGKEGEGRRWEVPEREDKRGAERGGVALTLGGSV